MEAVCSLSPRRCSVVTPVTLQQISMATSLASATDDVMILSVLDGKATLLTYVHTPVLLSLVQPSAGPGCRSSKTADQTPTGLTSRRIPAVTSLNDEYMIDKCNFS